MSKLLPPVPTDADAIRRSLSEPHAFASVFDRHFDAVHGFVQRRVGSDLADDVAAETFARAFDLRRRYDLARPDARPWLLGIAVNLLRRHWRTERRRLAAYGRTAAADPAIDALPAEIAAELADVLDELAARDRDALLLHVWADLSYEEIAVALGVRIGTVRSRIFRARRQLRERLGGAGPVTNASHEPLKESSHA